MVKSKRQCPEPGPVLGSEGSENRGPAIRLSQVRAGAEATVTGLEGGKGLCSRLSALGILPGSRLKVKCNLGGPVVIEVKGSRVSLGRGMAMKIAVKS